MDEGEDEEEADAVHKPERMYYFYHKRVCFDYLAKIIASYYPKLVIHQNY